jgi:hypothetical protein
VHGEYKAQLKYGRTHEVSGKECERKANDRDHRQQAPGYRLNQGTGRQRKNTHGIIHRVGGHLKHGRERADR